MTLPLRKDSLHQRILLFLRHDISIEANKNIRTNLCKNFICRWTALPLKYDLDEPEMHIQQAKLKVRLADYNGHV